MGRNKLIEMIVEKLLLAIVASIVLLLFKYYVEIQRNVDEEIFQQGIGVRDAIAPVKSVRDNVIVSIGALVDAIDAHGVTLSGVDFEKTLADIRSDLEADIRVMKGLKAALGKAGEEGSAEFGTDTIALLEGMNKPITATINLENNQVESHLGAFETIANSTAEAIYSSTASDLVVGSQIVLADATSEFRSSVTTSLREMLRPILLISIGFLALAALLWAFRKNEPERPR